MTINFFLGARRLALLFGGAAVIAMLVAFNQGAYKYAEYSLAAPNAPFKRSNRDECPSTGRQVLVSDINSGGNKFSVWICLESMTFTNKNNEEVELIPYKTDANGMKWGTSSNTLRQGPDSPELSTYISQVEKRFIVEEAKIVWRSQVAKAMVHLAAGLAIYGALVWVIGWVVRGFLGIPIGMDKRLDLQPSPPAPLAVAQLTLGERDHNIEERRETGESDLSPAQPVAALTSSTIPLSLAVACAAISFSVSAVFLLRNFGVTFTNLAAVQVHPKAFFELIAEAVGYSFGLPVIHVALASLFQSMRNSNSRRKIFIGWAIVAVIANLAAIAGTNSPSAKVMVPQNDPQASVNYDVSTKHEAPAQILEQLSAALERKDYATAFAGYQILAENGNAEAQIELGTMYAFGRSVPKDEQKAMAWYRKAADQGNASAQGRLGVMYENGMGVPKDYQQAAVWYRKAADQGNASAQAILGMAYAEGLGVPKDDAQAVVWYRKAAEQGNNVAQANLGLLYSEGRGVAKDDQQAAVWFRKAAEQGQVHAQYNLGRMFGSGLSVPKDAQQSVVWYRKAAEQGHVESQYQLGLLYDKGQEGVPRDYQAAYFWSLLATAHGNQNAAELRDSLEFVLAPDQRAAAQDAVRNWKPKADAQSNNVTP